MKKRNRIKEPTLFSKLITIYYEQAKRRRALRLLNKQSWSVEFLTELLVKASRHSNIEDGITMSITSRNGTVLTINSKNALRNSKYSDDDILNKLDDDTAINDFIARHSMR